MPIDPIIFVPAAIGIIIVIALLVRSTPRNVTNLKQTPNVIPKPHLEEESIIYQSGNFTKTQEDIDFEQIFHENFRAFADEAHYTKIAGAKHRNDDGTSRTAAIRNCLY